MFGGSFDPPHIGHMAAIQHVAETLELDEVMLVPTAVSPLKGGRDASDPPTGGTRPAGFDSEPTPPGLRLRMLRAAAGDHPAMTISDAEIRRGGVSYTVDTLRELREGRPGDQLFLVIGADQWADFGRWREPAEVAKLARVVVMTRDGVGSGMGARAEPVEASGVAALPDPVEVAVPRIDISSTDIRNRVREGRSIRYLVPDDVRRIIEAAKLYIREP